MRILYFFGILLYGFAVRIASLFNTKAKAWINGRKNWQEKMPDLSNKKVIWMHCASLGEFDQGLPVLRQLKEKHPNYYFLVTFFSPSGMQHYHKRNAPVDFACYLPVDSPKNAKKFVELIQPETVFFVKYEFWVNYIHAISNSNAKLYSVATLLRPSQRFFKWYGGIFRKTLRKFDHFFVQNKETYDLLHSIQLENVTIVGDTRFDTVLQAKEKAKENAVLEEFTRNSTCTLIIGSSWPEDEKYLLPLVNKRVVDKVIIAPHDISASHIKSIEKQLTVPCQKYTSEQVNSSANVLLLDTIGHLQSAYKYAHIAYIGGGFTGNLHNILEPAVYGLPTIFGPKFKKFPEATLFLQKNASISISNTKELEKGLTEVLKNMEMYQGATLRIIEKNKGATNRIVKKISF